jgi:hypothetical protein
MRKTETFTNEINVSLYIFFNFVDLDSYLLYIRSIIKVFKKSDNCLYC